jgi:hypothetical protein
MTSRRRFLAKAGSRVSLPFLLAALLTVEQRLSAGTVEDQVLEFHSITSTCIDLARYDAKRKQLTVRYVGSDEDEFYRYDKVLPAIWERIMTLNKTGGVGTYFVTTVQQHPEQFPFQKMTIRSFKIH